jgi:hypothetical protein
MELEVTLSDKVSDLVSDRRIRVSCTVYLDLIPVGTSGSITGVAILSQAERMQFRELLVRSCRHYVDFRLQLALVKVRGTVFPETTLFGVLECSRGLSKITHMGPVVM